MAVYYIIVVGSATVTMLYLLMKKKMNSNQLIGCLMLNRIVKVNNSAGMDHTTLTIHHQFYLFHYNHTDSLIQSNSSFERTHKYTHNSLSISPMFI